MLLVLDVPADDAEDGSGPPLDRRERRRATAHRPLITASVAARQPTAP
jgi:hypothetical protein